MVGVCQIPPFTPPDEPLTSNEMWEYKEENDDIIDMSGLTYESKNGESVGVYLLVIDEERNRWRLVWNEDSDGWVVNQRRN